MLLPLLLATALHLAPADPLTGTWRFTGDVVGNPVNEVCTLAQAGAKVTGTCRSTDGADAKSFDVTGEVKDGKFSLSHGGEYQGQALTLTYLGTVPTDKALAGTIDVQPFGVTGNFTAAPAAAAGAAAPAKP